MACVLIVEDEEVLRITFGEFLREEGHEVCFASSFDEAIDLIGEFSPHAVLTDILLGGKTGVDVLRYARERDPICPVILITGEPSVETAADAVRLGAFDYLSKPVTANSLKRVIRLALEQRRLVEERNAYQRQMDEYRCELDAIFNGVAAGVLMVGRNLRIKRFNEKAGRLFKAGTPVAIDAQISEVFAGDLEPIRRMVEECMESHAPVRDLRLEIGRTQAKRKTLMLTAAPLALNGDTDGGAVVLARDITRLTRLEERLEDGRAYRNIIGKSTRIREVFTLIEDLRETDSTVLIGGESGTGKELVAEAIHKASLRSEGPSVKINCAALPEEILESELFGHVKGAFTGAIRDRVGRFEAADGGTILLDEIGDVSPRLQLRLLRVLQEGEFERVGDSRSIKTDARVIASTNQDLKARIVSGEFREDLYYRLNVVRIDMPPLRERRDDIPLLVDHFCHHYNSVMHKEVVGFSPEAMEELVAYSWPGNVRELENVIERALVVCREPQIQVQHLPSEVSSKRTTTFVGNVHSGKEGDWKDLILQTLSETDWNVAKSARKLGVARNTLYQRMRSLGVSRPGVE